MKSLLALSLLFLCHSTCFSAIFYVPDDFGMIQEAVDQALDNDTVIVRPGTYFENIDFLGKAIVVRSEKGPAVTVVDGNQAGPVATFANGEGRDSVLEGFRLSNGLGWDGGGIACRSSSPTISANTIAQNGTYFGGGGIRCDSSSPLISGNVISNNWSSDGYGGGICCTFSDPIISNNVIRDNEMIQCGEKGGGIYCRDSSPLIANNIITGNSGNYGSGGGIFCQDSAATMINNTVCGNTTLREGGGICCSGGTAAIVNTILRDNAAGSDPQVHGDGVSVTFCNVEGGWPGQGNIDADPLFVDPLAGDFHLTFDSPCRNRGDNNAIPPAMEEDWEGDPRIVQGVVDIGADEFYFHLYETGPALPGTPIDIKVVGYPGTAPVRLGLGAGILDPPLHTAYGYLFLASPIRQFDLGTIPLTGVLIHSATIPATWHSGDQKPLQALVGPLGASGSRLTNLLLLTVE